jgi:hypothetical protein
MNRETSSPAWRTTVSWRLRRFAVMMVVLISAFSGCRHIGPGTVAVDRFDYGASIADSWKQQTLLNIIKLRYMDLPVFLDVSSIVSGYSLQTGVSLNGTLYPEKGMSRNFGELSGEAIYTDRPTITYTPLTGEKFLRGMVTPIEPKNIFFLVQSGYPADFILALTVDSLNGVNNRSVSAQGVREADPEFPRVLELLREVQAAGALGMRIEETKSKNMTSVIIFRHEDTSAAVTAKAAEVFQLLKLPAGQDKFRLVYSPTRGLDGELAVNSRSLLQIMAAFSSRADLPKEHLADGRALPMPNLGEANNGSKTVKIHSGKHKPADSYAAVRYRGYWFWIDDRDCYTKRAFTAILFFFTLADTGSESKLPLITIPAQ